MYSNELLTSDMEATPRRMSTQREERTREIERVLGYVCQRCAQLARFW